jgi:hydrogenase maturation protease
MRADGYTVILHKNGALASRQIRIPAWLARTLLITAIVVVVVVAAIVAAYGPILTAAAKEPFLQRRVAQLTRENQRVDELAAALNDAEARYARLRGMLGGDAGKKMDVLLGRLSGRRALIIVDAVKTGAPPGTIHRMTLGELRNANPGCAGSAHEGNAGELLAAAQLLDELPNRLFVVGVEPKKIATGLGLSAHILGAIAAFCGILTAGIRQV